METITVRPDLLRSFGESRDSAFCLVTSPEYAQRFTFEPSRKYSSARVLTYAGDVEFARFMGEHIPTNAHVLVILPGFYFKSPPPDVLGAQRKLGVMACYSTPTSAEAISHFLRMAERTEPERQEQMAREFFERGESVERLVFVDAQYGTRAEFEHLGDELSWHEQVGFLGWGQQQLLPCGEISVLPVQVFGQNIDSRFRMNGRLALRGHPVLHAGTPSFLPEDQERIFRKLATLAEHAVIAEMDNGLVVRFEPTHPDCAPAAEMLTRMCEVDSRYATLLEIGFGINCGLELLAGNAAMNEVYGGRNGAVHFGLGLIPYTQYHLDLICPGTQVVGERRQPVFG
jgi:hypothetical protein